nr:hypothetical protein [Rhizobium lusitanum]
MRPTLANLPRAGARLYATPARRHSRQ